MSCLFKFITNHVVIFPECFGFQMHNHLLFFFFFLRAGNIFYMCRSLGKSKTRRQDSWPCTRSSPWLLNFNIGVKGGRKVFGTQVQSRNPTHAPSHVPAQHPVHGNVHVRNMKIGVTAPRLLRSS